ncbi:hypothetical protein [Pseudoalteromonas luteoviolacea]|uniref:hypothetical protein n=1 Tax=Pseudoalteromonas luteoviolacea TaxID=43657 RepID=UPI0018C862A4|nr:hypothetical protein [Pseudoalteromonas luteoviolacea]
MKKELINSVLFTLLVFFINLTAHADDYITCHSCSSITSSRVKQGHIFLTKQMETACPRPTPFTLSVYRMD